MTDTFGEWPWQWHRGRGGHEPRVMVAGLLGRALWHVHHRTPTGQVAEELVLWARADVANLTRTVHRDTTAEQLLVDAERRLRNWRIEPAIDAQHRAGADLLAAAITHLHTTTR